MLFVNRPAGGSQALPTHRPIEPDTSAVGAFQHGFPVCGCPAIHQRSDMLARPRLLQTVSVFGIVLVVRASALRATTVSRGRQRHQVGVDRARVPARPARNRRTLRYRGGWLSLFCIGHVIF